VTGDRRDRSTVDRCSPVFGTSEEAAEVNARETMKSVTTKPVVLRRPAVKLVFLLSLVTLLGGTMAGSARADDRDWHDRDRHEREWQEREWRQHQWHERRQVVVYPNQYYGYAPPPVVYAPPPVVYAPPPGPPVLNFVFPLHIH
jgi:hypothetical protein